MNSVQSLEARPIHIALTIFAEGDSDVSKEELEEYDVQLPAKWSVEEDYGEPYFNFEKLDLQPLGHQDFLHRFRTRVLWFARA